MPIYTRWEKTKPVPKSLTKTHSLEEQFHALEEQLPALIDEITDIKPVNSEIGHPAFKSTFLTEGQIQKVLPMLSVGFLKN